MVRRNGIVWSNTPTYLSWAAMKARCLYPKEVNYHRYGGAGVTICSRWLGADGHLNFLADMGERPEGTTLGRLGDVGNYEPNNCKWMTKAEQVEEQKKKRALAAVA